jgi:CRP-like cAMP-binding protein
MEDQRGSRISLLLQELDADADAMIAQWPVMCVHGTGFDKDPSGTDPSPNAAEDSFLNSSLNAAPHRPAAEKSGGAKTGGPSLSFKQQQVVLRATQRKRVMMIQVLATIALFHAAMDYRKRVMLLRSTIERVFLRGVRARRNRRKNVGGGVVAEKKGATYAEELWKPTGSELQSLHHLFSGCPASVLDELVGAFEKRDYAAGEVVCTAGEAGLFLWFISAGRLEATDDGTPYGPKTVFGDVFGTPLGHRKTVIAQVASVTWRLTKRSVDNIMHSPGSQPEARGSYLRAQKDAYRAVLAEAFPLAGCEKRVPILRNIDKVIMSRHWPRLEPVVLEKGDVLFKAGTNASSVYILVDGEVERIVPASADGPEMTQVLCVSRHGAPKNGRYALLGEEPHILPEKHRYTCCVASDIAGVYVMSGAVFMDILLDDAKLYLAMRSELLVRRSKKMKLRSKEDALRQLPILTAFPPSRVQALLPHLTARCMERGATLCQSQQPLKELFLIVKGEIRDPRDKSTTPRLLPRSQTESPTTATKPVGSTQPVVPIGISSKGGRTLSLTNNNTSSNRLLRSGSSVATECVSGAVAAVFSGPSVRREFCVEADDLNPTLPAVFAQGFVHALAGDYEGLLYEKWTESWEAASVVEMWVLPTLAIRNEFNEMPRPHQLSVLQDLRRREATMLGLAEPRNAKLPPMSSLKGASQQQQQLQLQQQQNAKTGRYGILQDVPSSSASVASSGKPRRDAAKDPNLSVASTSNSESEGSSHLPSAETSQLEASRSKRTPRASNIKDEKSHQHAGSHTTSSSGTAETGTHPKETKRTTNKHQTGNSARSAAGQDGDDADDAEKGSVSGPLQETLRSQQLGEDVEEEDEEALERRRSVRRRDLAKLAMRQMPLKELISLQIKAKQEAYERARGGRDPPAGGLHPHANEQMLAQGRQHSPFLLPASSPRAHQQRMTAAESEMAHSNATQRNKLRREALLYLQGVDVTATEYVIRDVDPMIRDDGVPFNSSSPRSLIAVGRLKGPSPPPPKSHVVAVASQPHPTVPASIRGSAALPLLPLADVDDDSAMLIIPSPRTNQGPSYMSPMSPAQWGPTPRPRWPSPPRQHRAWFQSPQGARERRAVAPEKKEGPPSPPQKPTFDVSLKRVLLTMEGR